MRSGVRRVLFIRTDRLGETILNVPAVAALKAGLPEASVTLLVHPDLRDLLARLPVADRVMACEPGDGPWWGRAWRLARRLRADAFEAAIVSNPKKELHAAVWLAGIPRRIGYARKWGWTLTDRVPDRKALGGHHEVEYNLELVRTLGFPAVVPQWQWPRFERERADVLQLLAQQGVQASEPLVAVHPWSSNPRKEWPAARFSELIGRLSRERGERVVLIGGPEERRRVPEVLPGASRAADLVGRLTLTQLAALLQGARLLISNDSGPVHLAASVGTPTVALFGTSDPATGPRRWGPWGPGHAVLCQPTIGAIGVDEVMAAAARRLG